MPKTAGWHYAKTYFHRMVPLSHDFCSCDTIEFCHNIMTKLKQKCPTTPLTTAKSFMCLRPM